MKALSLRQPWAWAVVHGGKRIENRTWRPAKPYGQRLVIHAARTWGTRQKEDLAWIQDNMKLIVPDNLPLGYFVGVATVADCHPNGPEPEDPWAIACKRCWRQASVAACQASPKVCTSGKCSYGWLLDDVVALAEPVPGRGALGLFPVPELALRQILAQLEGR